VIDRALLIELEQAVGHDTYRDLFATLLGQLKLSAERLEAALGQSDWAEVERHAHSIVSPAGHLGALKLATSARGLSQRARSLHLGMTEGREEADALAKEATLVRGLMARSLDELARIGAEERPAG
jgi:HPt (histidine-containing phosphotransfer) domain-containing protein